MLEEEISCQEVGFLSWTMKLSLLKYIYYSVEMTEHETPRKWKERPESVSGRLTQHLLNLTHNLGRRDLTVKIVCLDY